ncbi:hypothetical protein BJ166DRAFT_513742 [Pestalotiopsis sp. NC0098]|nr:hypothetical protein BJ166DRAFT_513742 [Pestalotiopsis sp. NC0098]
MKNNLESWMAVWGRVCCHLFLVFILQRGKGGNMTAFPVGRGGRREGSKQELRSENEKVSTIRSIPWIGKIMSSLLHMTWMYLGGKTATKNIVAIFLFHRFA